MRRLLAYLIMMLTAIGAIVFNVQSVLEGTNEALEFGRSTELVFALNKRDAEDYSSNDYPSYFDPSTAPKNLDEIDIAEEVMDRLDLAGVRNANVQVVDGDSTTNVGYELRVTLSPLSDTELNNVKTILGHTGYLSIGTFGDDSVYYEGVTGERQFFDTDDDIATLVYDGTTPYPAINVYSSEIFETLSSEAESAGETHANDTVEGEEETTTTDEDGEETDNGRGTTLYLWMNKTTEDTFDKAYGVNDQPIVQEVRNKVLAEIDVADFDSSTNRLLIRTDLEGNAFTISTARAFVNALNAPDYGFDIEFLYQNSVAPAFGTGAINTCYLVMGIAIAVVAILLVLLFGLSGVTGAVTLALSGFASLWLVSLLGFEFSVASICGVAVVMVLSLFLSANYFHHVVLEFPKKETLEKANREGYHKAYFLSLDSSVVLLIVSLFGFLFATGSFQTFFGTIMIGTIVTYILTTYLNKWATYWLVKDSDKGLFPYFTLFGTKKERKAKTFVGPKNKTSRVVMPVLGVLSAALLAISLPVSNAMGEGFHVFNNSGSYAPGYTLSVSYRTELQSYNNLQTSQRFLLYLQEIGLQGKDGNVYYAISESDTENPNFSSEYAFVYYPETASFNTLEKTDEEGATYFVSYFSVDVDRDLSTLALQSGIQFTNFLREAILEDSIPLESENVIIAPGQDPHFTADELLVGAYDVEATNVYHSSVNLFLLVFLLPVLVAVYLLIRYGILVSLSGLVAGELYSALLVGLLSATQIPFNSYSAFGLLAGFALFLTLIVPLVGMNKVVLKERGIRRDASVEERAEIANAEASLALPTLLATILGSILLFLAFFFLDSQTIALGAIGVVSSFLVFPFLYFFLLPLYHLLSIHVNFRRIHTLYEKHREKKGVVKAKPGKDGVVYVDEDSPHETIVPGLNDFRF